MTSQYFFEKIWFWLVLHVDHVICIAWSAAIIFPFTDLFTSSYFTIREN
jgi:hypothetical protein